MTGVQNTAVRRAALGRLLRTGEGTGSDNRTNSGIHPDANGGLRDCWLVSGDLSVAIGAGGMAFARGAPHSWLGGSSP